MISCRKCPLWSFGVEIYIQQVSCFSRDIFVITFQANETYVNVDCSEKCVCNDGLLSCNSSYTCNYNATCSLKDGIRRCYCNDGYAGDGETCVVIYRDCYDAYLAGYRQDGVYTLLPEGWMGLPFNVSCDMSTAGGGWTVSCTQQARNAGTANIMSKPHCHMHLMLSTSTNCFKGQVLSF